ncbi:MAG: sulfotransferase family 2 domain-containing protein [Synechococcales bacterium]|nr:sulfotransferase family 2 domain-containing protein [Synechococcales bacterium]
MIQSQSIIEQARNYLEQGNKLRSQGKIEQSVQKYCQSIEIKPDFIPSLIKLAEAYESQSDWESEIICLSRIIELKPDIPAMHLRLARALKKQGNYFSSFKAYEKAAELKQDWTPEIYQEIGDAYKQNCKLGEAALFYQKAIYLSPSNHIFYLSLGDLYSSMSDFAVAAKVYQQVLKSNSGHRKKIYEKLAASYIKLGQHDEARQASKFAALLSEPRPLFSNKHNLTMLFSAKAGCTFAAKWFFYQAGLLDAAEAYHSWIHNFRVQVFYKSAEYRESIDSMLDSSTNTIKIVRNPYSRAVSSYIHAIKYGYADTEMKAYLGREVTSERKFSFREFVGYLSSIDLWNCDIHHRIQVSLLEREAFLKVDYTVHLEESLTRLKSIEMELNLKDSNYSLLSKSSHHTSRAEFDDFSGDKIFCLRPSDKSEFIPHAKSFYDDELQAKISYLYAIDFLQYGYDKNVLP